MLSVTEERKAEGRGAWGWSVGAVQARGSFLSEVTAGLNPKGEAT